MENRDGYSENRRRQLIRDEADIDAARFLDTVRKNNQLDKITTPKGTVEFDSIEFNQFFKEVEKRTQFREDEMHEYMTLLKKNIERRLKP